MARDFFSIGCGTGIAHKFHNSRMAKQTIPFHARAWRKHRNLKLEEAAKELRMSAGRLSDLELRRRRFNETHLQRMAEVYKCDPTELLTRDPVQTDTIWSILQKLPKERRQMATEMLQGLAQTANAKAGQ